MTSVVTIFAIPTKEESQGHLTPEIPTFVGMTKSLITTHIF